MKTQHIRFLLIIILVITACQSVWAVHATSRAPRYLTYVGSTQERLSFCNGDKMDSQAYRKTITQVHVTKIPVAQLSKEQQLNKTAALVITMMHGPDVARGYHGRYITLKGNTAYVKPTDGWAGVSIYLCAYQPLLEVNLLRYSFVKKVVWQSMA